jgi:hypothetical protein
MSKQGIHIEDSGSKETSETIRAHGDIRFRIGVLWLVGIICVILSMGGVAAFFASPDRAKDIWVIIGPIISAGMTGVVGFLAGERAAKR